MAEVDIMYGKGISREGEIVDLGAEYEVLQKSGHGTLMMENVSVKDEKILRLI